MEQAFYLSDFVRELARIGKRARQSQEKRLRRKGQLDEAYLTHKAKEYGVTDLLARVAAGDVY